MEANEAPEKIYLEWYHVGDEKYREWVITPKTNNEPIEYTRTDAFIEKACEWLKNSSYGYLTEKWGEIDLDREELAVDFANYIKGE